MNEQKIIVIVVFFVLLNICFIVFQSIRNSMYIKRINKSIKDESIKNSYMADTCNKKIKHYNTRMTKLKELQCVLKKKSTNTKLCNKINSIHTEILEEYRNYGRHEKAPSEKDYIGFNVYKFGNKKRLDEFKSKCTREIVIDRNKISGICEYIDERMCVLDNEWGDIEALFEIVLLPYPEMIKERIIKIIKILVYTKPDVGENGYTKEYMLRP